MRGVSPTRRSAGHTGAHAAAPRGARAALSRIFALDLRSLALSRVALGLCVLADLARRAPLLEAHYTDAGFLPRALRAAHMPQYAPSLYSLFDGSAPVAALMALHAAAATCLVLGLRTRLATALTWALLVSLHNRNPALLNGGDVLLSALLFWGMFLPLGARASLDARRGAASASADAPTRVCNLASAALIVQLVLVYLVVGWSKRGAPWHDGSAVYYAMQLDLFARPAALWLRAHPALMQAASWATLLLERLGPLLLLIPFGVARLRLLAVALFCALHLAILLCLDVGLFPLVALAAWSALLPGAAWDRLTPRARAAAGAQAWAGPGARARIASRAGTPPWARTRTLALSLALILVVLLNARTLTRDARARLQPGPLDTVAHALGLAQGWTMFAPAPPTDDGWFVLSATLRDGRRVDLRTGAPASWDKPPRVLDTFVDNRERRYLLNARERPELREGYARFHVRRWNGTHPAQAHVVEATLDFMREETLPDGIAPPKRERLWSGGAR